jgi:phosphatidylglycerol---prolipoprotein diacylglyceryl transferase
MEFPVRIPFFWTSLHPHVVFEVAAWFAGFLAFRFGGRRRADVVSKETRAYLSVIAVVGVAIGVKLAAWLDDPFETLRVVRESPALALQGRSIVGGLFGGVVAVRVARRRHAVAVPTGDRYALPFLVSAAIGRIGCFLTGLPDRTHGVATSLPFGVDFGDGVRRHPLQLYECGFLLLLAAFLAVRDRRLGDRRPPGALFDETAAVYFAWRFGIDFLKPYAPYFGLFGGVQLIALCGLVWFRRGIFSLLSRKLGAT